MKINITNEYRACNLCGQGSYIQVEFVNNTPNGTTNVHVCKSCIRSIWKTIENVECILCAKCGKPIRVERILKESESGYEYRIVTPGQEDPTTGAVFCDVCSSGAI
jgi:RecJ-like exonuclease